MEPPPEPNNALWPFPSTEHNWEQTPPAVQASLHTLYDEVGQLQARVARLEARRNQTSTPSSRSLSSDAPSKKQRGQTGACGSSPQAPGAHNRPYADAGTMGA